MDKKSSADIHRALAFGDMRHMASTRDLLGLLLTEEEIQALEAKRRRVPRTATTPTVHTPAAPPTADNEAVTLISTDMVTAFWSHLGLPPRPKEQKRVAERLAEVLNRARPANDILEFWKQAFLAGVEADEDLKGWGTAHGAQAFLDQGGWNTQVFIMVKEFLVEVMTADSAET